MAIRPDILAQVFRDNQNDAQIGGITDGISTEVAADMGYTATEEELAEIIRRSEAGDFVLQTTDPVIPEPVRLCIDRGRKSGENAQRFANEAKRPLPRRYSRPI